MSLPVSTSKYEYLVCKTAELAEVGRRLTAQGAALQPLTVARCPRDWPLPLRQAAVAVMDTLLAAAIAHTDADRRLRDADRLDAVSEVMAQMEIARAEALVRMVCYDDDLREILLAVSKSRPADFYTIVRACPKLQVLELLRKITKSAQPRSAISESIQRRIDRF